jgi:hypothetical protein
MKRTTALGVLIPALAAALVLASVPGALAQDPKGGGGGGGGGQGGGARGGGGDAGGSRGGGAVSSAPTAAPSGGGGFSGGGPVFGGGGSSGGSGMSAVPRGAGRTNEGGGRQAGVASPRWGGGAGTGREGRADGGSFGRSAVDDQVAGRSRAGAGSSGVDSSAPWYARSRGANPATGTAVNRPDVPSTGPPVGGYYPPGYPSYPGYYPGYGGGYYDCGYYPYYPYGCGNPWGYGAFGLGYFYFNPFMWDYANYGWGGFGGGGGGGGTYSGAQMGSIRLKVKPNNASVYVDGYYAGTVDDFDNSFQKLSVALGTHKIEISAPGYQPLIFEIDVRDFDTINYQGQLEPIR